MRAALTYADERITIGFGWIAGDKQAFAPNKKKGDIS